MAQGKRLLLFATGGTIATRRDADGRAVPVLGGAELLGALPPLHGVESVDIVEVSRLGGPQLTVEGMFDLARRVDAALAADYDGVVITQGTDTLEESCFLLDLVLATDKPVVFTAAMRGADEAGADGIRNLWAALMVAADVQAHEAGVLVVFGDQIFAAVDATKVHTASPMGFEAPGRGPLGFVVPARQRVVFVHRSLTRQKLAADGIVADVPIVTAALGGGAALLRAALTGGAAGIVIETLGTGNLPPDWEPAVRAAVAAEVPVVLASRVSQGPLLDAYAYPGGGARLREAGALFAQGLNAAKARIKLMLALNVSRDPRDLRELFEYLY